MAEDITNLNKKVGKPPVEKPTIKKVPSAETSKGPESLQSKTKSGPPTKGKKLPPPGCNPSPCSPSSCEPFCTPTCFPIDPPWCQPDRSHTPSSIKETDGSLTSPQNKTRSHKGIDDVSPSNSNPSCTPPDNCSPNTDPGCDPCFPRNCSPEGFCRPQW